MKNPKERNKEQEQTQNDAQKGAAPALRLSSFLDRSFRASAFYSFFRSHYKAERNFSESALCRALPVRKLRMRMRLLKNGAARQTETSAVAGALSGLYERLCRCSIHCYAVALLYFGIFSAAAAAIQNAAGLAQNGLWNVGPLYTSALIIVLSFLLLPVHRSFLAFFGGNGVTGTLLRGLFVLRDLSADDAPYIPPNGLLILIGTAGGLLSAFVGSFRVLLCAAVLFLALSFLKTPENALPVLILACPFCSGKALAAMSLFAFAAYLFKVLRGKRSFAMRYFDLLYTLMLLILFVGGYNALHRGALDAQAGAILCLSLIYYPVRNCVRTETLCRKCVTALAACAALSSLAFLAERVSALYGIPHFAAFHGGAPHFLPFENGVVFGEFLLVLLPFTLSVMILSKGGAAKTASAVVTVLCAAALVFTDSKGILIAFAICMLIYITASFHNPLASLVTLLIVYAAVSVLIPQSSFLGSDRFFNVSDYRETILLSSTDLVSDNFLAGIGIGDEAFARLFGAYTGFGSGRVVNSGNFYMQLFAQVGFFGFCFFFCAAVNYFKMQFSSLSENRTKNFFTALLAISSISTASVLLLRGLTSVVFHDSRVLFVSAIIMALSAAMYYSSESASSVYSEG